MKNKLLLLGGGGHAESILDTIKSLSDYSVYGILDSKKELHTKIQGAEIIGRDEDLLSFYQKGIKYAVLSVGSVGNPKIRISLYQTGKKIGFQFPNIIDPSSVLSQSLVMGEGNFIGKGVILGPDVTMGNGCIVNTGAILEHGTSMGDFVHVAPGCVLLGNVTIGANTHIGANTTLLQNVTIGKNSLIGAGSLVLNHIPSHCLAYGSPAKEVGYYE